MNGRFDNMKIFIGLIMLAGIVILQIILSKKDNKFLGLVFPLFNILFSIIRAIGFTPYIISDGGSTADIVIVSSTTIIIYNISTLLLLSIYYYCRKKQDN